MSLPPIFKHIPCPNGATCENVGCLFGHPPDALTAAPTASRSSADTSRSPPSPPPSTARPGSRHGSSGRDKRVKTSHAADGASETLPAAAPAAPPMLSRASEGSSDSPATQSTAVAARSPTRLSPKAAPFQPGEAQSASPSPLKRKRRGTPDDAAAAPRRAAAGDQTPLGGPSPHAANGAAASPAGPGGTAAAAPPRAPPALDKRKPETLNPRFVAKAPARHEIRLRLVKLLHQEFTRLDQLLASSSSSQERPEDGKHYHQSPQGLVWMALDMEEHYATTKSATVYADTIKHRIMEFKRMTVGQWVKVQKELRDKARLASRQNAASAAAAAAAAPTTTARAHHEALASASAPAAASASASAGAPPAPIVTGLPASQEHVLLRKHFLTRIDQLARHGYVPAVPTDAEIQRARDAEAVAQGWEQCERCTRRFQVFPDRREEDGALTSGGPCQYHPGRLNRSTQVFSCCNESAADNDARGCETSPSHVFKVTDPKRLAALWNFAETPARRDGTPPADQPAPEPAVCFDCEMAYTVYGMEVVRLTATRWPSGEALVDVLVRPKGAVIDFNSRFSGVFAADFGRARPYSSAAAAAQLRAEETKMRPSAPSTPSAPGAGGHPALLLVASPEAARALLQRHIAPDTVLIGHALENDLRALRMVHNRVADTVLLFPHPKGLPVRYSLRALAKEHMDRIVQAGGGADGHDSAEDARVAGELVRTKIKTKWADMRRAGWRLVDGVMTETKA